MHSALFSLAQFDAASAEAPFDAMEQAISERFDLLCHPAELQSTLGQVHPLWAGIFAVVGALCLTHGLAWHKMLLVTLSAMTGAVAGLWLGDQLGGAHNVSAATGAILFALLSLPAVRFAVAMFGGLAGAFVGANVWTAIGRPEDLAYVGALVGLVALGMLAFTASRMVTILYTSIIGAGLLVLGGLAMLLRVDSLSAPIDSALTDNRFVLPLVAAATAAVGVIMQQGGGIRTMLACPDKACAKPKAKPA